MGLEKYDKKFIVPRTENKVVPPEKPTPSEEKNVEKLATTTEKLVEV